MTKIRVRVEDGRKSLPNVTADKGVQCGKENGPCVCLSHEEEHQPLPSVGTTVRIDSEDDEDTKAAKKRGRETLGARKVRRKYALRNETKNTVESRADESKVLRLTPDVKHENRSERKPSSKDDCEFGDISDYNAANEDVESEATLEGEEEWSDDLNSSSSKHISWGYVEEKRHNSHHPRSQNRRTSVATASDKTWILPKAKRPSTPIPQGHLVEDEVKEATMKKVQQTSSGSQKKDNDDNNRSQQADAEQEQVHLEGYRIWQEENIGVRHDVEGKEYSQSEAKCFDNASVALDLEHCESLITRGPGNAILIHKKFYIIANEIFFQHLFPVLGIYDAITDGIKNCTMSKWFRNKVNTAVMTAFSELAHDAPILSVAGSEYTTSAETCLEYYLKHLTLEICRHRRIEDFLSDLAYFEKVKGRRTEMYKDGEGLLLRIFRCLYDEDLPHALQASSRPADNARLIGAKWPVWTDKPLDQYANLKDFLGVDDEEVLKSIGHFIAGLPKTAEAFRFLYAWYKDHEPRPAEGRASLGVLKKVWYGGKSSNAVISREGRLDRNDHALKLIWSQLSTGEKEAVKTLCRVEEERSLDGGW